MVLGHETLLMPTGCWATSALESRALKRASWAEREADKAFERLPTDLRPSACKLAGESDARELLAAVKAARTLLARAAAGGDKASKKDVRAATSGQSNWLALSKSMKK